MKKITIVKLGGNVLSDPVKFNAAIESFSAISGAKVLIHGGGSEATDLARRMGVKVEMVEGRRITNDEMIEIVIMVYAGKVNKKVVASLQAQSINAIGLSGADGNLILSNRRPVKDIDYGHVGDVINVNGVALVSLLKVGFVPVFCALTHDGKGNMLNTNADTIASMIAVELAKSFLVKLCFAFELKGVLSNFEDKNSVIHQISEDQFKKMKADQTVNAGMIPKIFNALNASKDGVQEVYICQFDSVQNPENGTRIC